MLDQGDKDLLMADQFHTRRRQRYIHQKRPREIGVWDSRASHCNCLAKHSKLYAR